MSGHPNHGLIPKRRRTVLAIVCLALVGCEWKGGPRHNGPAGGDVPDHWVIQPVRMRVYPTTRFVTEGDDTVLNAWVELFDEADDPTKAVGLFHFELYPAGRIGVADDATRLFSWDVPVLTLEQNRQFYDPVTRAYLFRLKVERPGLADRRLTLRVSLSPPAGRRLQTETTLGPDQGADGN